MVAARNGFHNVHVAPKKGQLTTHRRTGAQILPPTQLSIFSNSGLHTVVRDVKESLNAEVKASGRSRDQVLDQLNELAKRHGISLSGRGHMSKDLLEKWLNVDDDSRVPGLKGLTLLCAALETTAPLAALVKPLGGRVIGPADVKLLEWAKTYQKSKDLRKRMRKLEEELR